MISIYSSAFNIIKNQFDYICSINKFCNFADEVVVAVNTSDDSSLESIRLLCDVHSNLKIYACDFSYSDPLLDGKIKNFALQNTSMPIKLGLDMDEYIPSKQKLMWYRMADMLLNEQDCYCYMIPSINLYKNITHYSSITPKWYLHKSNLYRGPVNFARNTNGTIDTNKSDSCELIDKNGNLVASKMTPSSIEMLRSNNLPFVIHTGYLDIYNRLLRNQNFWQNHWLVESGGIRPKHKIHESIDDFNEPHSPHLLDI